MSLVANVFIELQNFPRIEKKHLRILFLALKKERNGFKEIKSCYVQILNALKEFKLTQKACFEIYDKLIEKLFEFLLEKEREIEKDVFKEISKKFLNFFADNFETSFLQIQAFCSKHIIIILKVLQKAGCIYEIIEPYLLEKLLAISLYLLFQRNSIKKQGIILGSILATFSTKHQHIYPKLRVFSRELLQLLSSDPNKEIRKLAISAIAINSETLPHLLTRLRDIDTEIPIILFRKLITEKVLLANLEVSEIYKLLYEGINSRDPRLKKESLFYFKRNYEYFQEETDRKATWNDIKNQLLDFLKLFQLKETLRQPKLYLLLEDFFSKFVLEILTNENCLLFLTNFLLVEMKKNKQGKPQLYPEEVYFLKILIKTKKNPDFIETLEEVFPSLFEFLPLIKLFVKNKNLLGFYESLQLAELMINSEEKGKEKFIEDIRDYCLDIALLSNENFPIKYSSSQKFNEIYEKIDIEKLKMRSFLRQFTEPFFINNLNDLLEFLLKILYKLVRDSNLFIISVMEIISELKLTIENQKDNDQDNNLKDFLENLNLKIKMHEKLMEKLETEIEIKGKQGGNSEYRILLKEKQHCLNKINSLQSEKLIIEKNIERIQLRCLKLLIALLRITPINLKHPGNSNLLSSFIGPMLISINSEIKENALLALSLYVSIDQNLCLEYSPIFLQFLDNSPVLTQIISLRSLFDFFILYDNPQEDVIIKKLKQILFQNNENFKSIALEGFCKLISNRKLKKSNCLNILAHLLLLWCIGSNENESESFQVQMISLFFRNFTWKNNKNLQAFEKAFEIIVKAFIILYKEKVHFKKDSLVLELGFLSNFLKIGLYLLKNQDNKNYDKNMSPQEKFFVFLCRVHVVNSNDSQINELFEKTLQNFDFTKTFENKSKNYVFNKFLTKLMQYNSDNKKRKGLSFIREKFKENIKELEKQEVFFNLSEFQKKREVFLESSINCLIHEWKNWKVIDFSRLNLTKYHISFFF